MQTEGVSATWQLRVNRVIDHVHNNLADNLSLDVLSAVATASPFHFHRIFRALVGETPALFVRRARLDRAAHLMMAAPRRSLTTIAMEVGFPGLSEFSRAFRETFGLAPSRWDRRTRLLDPAPQVSTQLQTAAPQPVARLVNLPQMRLAYVRQRGVIGLDDLSAGYQRLCFWLDNHGVNLDEQQLVGMSWDNYETTPLAQVRYDFAFSVPPHVSDADEFGIYQLPAVQLVAVRCQGPMVNIALAWDYLYEQWFPASRFAPAHLPAFKIFHQRPDQTGWRHWDVDCAIALVRA